jgi:hypothetical protein
MSSNPHLDQARADMERAKRDAEDAKRVYNRKAKAEGNHTLAALLVNR